MKDVRLVVISGPSGAGKSTAVKALEDLGLYCVVNLPVALLPKFLELMTVSSNISRVAVVVDVRERVSLRELPTTLDSLRACGYRIELLFLEASDDALIRRFSETRRKHPVEGVLSPLEGIAVERELLTEIKAKADLTIDTTGYNVHELRERLRGHFNAFVANDGEGGGAVTVNYLSFGYRYGVPHDADIVMDVRFLPNPYFIEELKDLSGKEPRVADFVTSKDECKEFMLRFDSLLSYLMPLYKKEGKSYLTIAIGCTGGRHRSVALVEALAEKGSAYSSSTNIRHRDIDKP